MSFRKSRRKAEAKAEAKAEVERKGWEKGRMGEEEEERCKNLAFQTRQGA